MKYLRKFITITLLVLIFGPLAFVNVPYSGSSMQDQEEKDVKMSSALLSLAESNESRWVDVIIQFKQSAKSRIDTILSCYECSGYFQVKTRYSIIPAVYACVHSSILSQIAENPFVEFIWEDGTCKAANIDYSPLIAGGEGSFVNFTEEIGATEFYKASIPGGNNTNGKSAVIAILDSGVDISGEILVGGDLDDFDDNMSSSDPKFLGAVSMLPDDTLYYSDLTGRGTFHAGIACGTGYWNKSYQGVAPGAYYLSVKIFDPLGITYWSIIISGIDWAISHGADIILFGGFLPGLYLDPISLSLNAASDQGIFVVVPSGDEGPAYMSMDSPGQTMKAICVGAYNSSSGFVADFSSRGPSFDFRTGPDVVAPGVNIISTRAKIFASSGGTIGTLGAFSFEGVNIAGIEVPGFQYGGSAGFTLPNGTLNAPDYGTPVEENYTRASGTGAAAAVVAGAIALLIQVFPTVTPAMMKIALRRSAHPILGDENSEGAGLIDVYAAYEYLRQYLDISAIYKFPASAPLVYPGAVFSIDALNISQAYAPFYADWQYWDSAVMLSSQAMMTASIIVNGSDVNSTQIFLPLNQFGVSYNLAKDSNQSSGGLLGAIDLESLLPNPDNKSFHWLSEFEVLREMHLASDEAIGSEQGLRYASVLSYGPLLVILVAETYDYSIEQNPINYTYTNRINAYKLNFHFLNLGSKPIQNLTLYSFFMAELFLNETGVISSISEVGSMNDVMNFTLDDSLNYDNETQMMYATDQDNGTSFLDHYGYKPWGAMGFNSTTHNQSGWQIANSVDLLLDITLNHTRLTNTSSYDYGVDDPGWAMLWDITPELAANGGHEAFTGVFGLGFGRENQSAYDSLCDQMWRVAYNVTNYNVTDLLIINASIPRIGYLNDIFASSAQYINIGTTTIQSAHVVFYTNRTLSTGQTEGNFVDTAVYDIEPFSVVTTNIEWDPIHEGVYSCAWVGADMQMQYGANETTYLNNYLARNVFIISEAKYNSFADEVMLITPISLPVKPFMLKHPGDLAIINISVISVRRQDTLQIGYEGHAESIFFFTQMQINVTNGYGILVGGALVPLLGASSYMSGNLTFYRAGGSVINRLPVQFEVEENRGRIFFDAIHDNLTITIRNTTIDFGWDERLDTTYGNFYNVREVWSNLTDKGASTMTIVPYLTFNLTEFGFDMSALSNSPGIGALLEKFLGPYSLSSNIISTNTTNADILQFFDVYVVCDPESPFKPEEITAITSWVEKGGHLLVWAENATENDVGSLNNLLSNFNLQITGNNSGVVKVSPGNRTNHAIFPKGGDLYLYDSVNFTASGGSAQILCTPGETSGPIAISTYGLGKIVAIGDKDMFNALHLREGNNSGFAEEIIQWFFERKFTWNLTTTPSRPITINLGDQMYINLEAIGDYKENSTKKVLYLSGFANSTGQMINASLYGFGIPVFPLFRSDGYNFVGEFDSMWDNSSGMHYVTIIIDAAAFPTETFIIPVNVLFAEPAPAPVIYEFPDSPYPHYLDIISILSIVIMAVYLWYYRLQKWRTRLRLTVLKDDLLFEAQARINEVNALLKQINRELGSDMEELEKIRLLLSTRKRIAKILKEFKKFGDRIGEYY